MFLSGCIPLDPATMKVVSTPHAAPFPPLILCPPGRRRNRGANRAQLPLSRGIPSLILNSSQTQALKNLSAVVEASGQTLADVVKTTVFLQSMADFPKVNAIYAAHFAPYKPARSTIQVAALPMAVLVEVEAIVTVSK